MSGKISRIARKYGAAAAVSLRNRLAYPGSFVGSLLTYGLFIFVFSRIWASVYASTADIAGYSRTMCVWYFVVAEIPLFAFGRFFWTLAQDIKSGQVAYLLARPYSFVGYQFAERMGGSFLEACVIVAEGAAIGFLVTRSFPLASAAQGAALVLSLLLSGSLQFFLQLAIALTAFWVEENQAFFWIFQKLALVVGTLMPLEFLPEGAQRLAWFTPFPLISYAPARIAVAWEAAAGLRLLAAQAAWLAAAILLSRGIFALGERRVAAQGG